jgi:hypothetical protein
MARTPLVVDFLLLAEYDKESDILTLNYRASDEQYSDSLGDFINKETPFTFLNLEQFSETIWDSGKVKLDQNDTLLLNGKVAMVHYDRGGRPDTFEYTSELLDNLGECTTQIVQFLKECELVRNDTYIGVLGITKLLVSHPRILYKERS